MNKKSCHFNKFKFLDIINFFYQYRIRINISVAYGSDIDNVRSILLEISKASTNICDEPIPRVRFRSFGDSGLILQLLFWIEKPEDRGRIVDEINSEIYKRFNKENI